MYQCSVCGKQIKTKCGYVKHELAHTTKFRCQSCGQHYRRKATLLKHSKHCVAQRQFTCAKCGSNFETLRELLGHHETHNVQTGGQGVSVMNGRVQIRTIHPTGIDKFDLVKFLANVRPAIERYLLSKVRQQAIKWYIVAQVKLSREDADGEIRTVEPYFRCVTYILLSPETFENHDLNQALQKLVIGLEKYIHESSGWLLRTVKKLHIHTIHYKPLNASSYIELPKTLQKSRTVLNIKNKDDKCFIWSILAHIHKVNENADRADNYVPYECQLNMKGIDYPVALCKLNQFERQNETVSINVFGFEKDEIYPLRITKQKERKHHINLLYLQRGDLSHYCLIRDLNGFLYRTKSHRSKTHFCPYCLHAFQREELMIKHIDFCGINGEQKIELPQKGINDTLKFSDFRKKMRCPFVLYCDFETTNKDVQTCMQNPNRSSSTITKQMEVCSFGYKRVCTDPRYTKESVIYRGPEASRRFIECLLKEEDEIKQILSHIEPLQMTEHDEINFANATHCSICENPFEEGEDGEECSKVIDHDHVTGLYRGAACSVCNFGFRICNFIPVIFHGFRNFDSHIICQTTGEYERKKQNIKCIPQNMERYISFSLGDLRFLDSFQFLSSSLESLTDNLKCTGGLMNFKHFSSEFNDEDIANLLLRKNVYPYDYMNDERRFQETRIPPKNAFYSQIKKSQISDEDYRHACNVFQRLGLSNLGEYTDLYLKTDVLLLTDIFENFRDISMRDYRLDPCHFYSAPGLSWSAMLLMTKVNLELVTDIDDILLWERGCRGGVSQISHRYAKANNPYLEDYDPSQPNSYIILLDANNLYGWSSMQPLPIGGFRRLTQEEISIFDVLQIPEDCKKGYLIETSLSYPQYLHDEHNCFPLAPIKRSVGEEELSPYAKTTWRQLRGSTKRPKCEKLLCTLEDKDRYVLHFRNLRCYLQLGLQIKEIHSVLEFDQEPWLKPYIDFNTMKRMQAKTEFEKSFYKILNCSVFGKLMERQRSHLDVTLTSQEKIVNKLTAKPTFKECVVFNENLVGVHCKRSKVLISKPVYAGQTVLDLSKMLMYKMWYCYFKQKYATQCQLLCTDSDSFLLYVETDDIYEDMKNDRHLFDLSESNKFQCCDNRKVPGAFKDELQGNVISKFCGLRSKMYAITYTDDREDGLETKKAKGVAKATIEKELCFKLYESTLFDKTEMLSSMDLIRSQSHNLYCERVRKKTLSCFDDKRWLFSDGISSLAYGHYYI